MNKKISDLQITCGVLCPMASNVINTLSKSSTVSFKTVLGTELIFGNNRGFYVDSERMDNLFGFCPDSEDLARLAETDSYTIKYLSRVDNIISAELIEVVDENGNSLSKNVDPETVKTLEKECKRVVDEGLVTKEELNERLAYLSENHVDEFLQLRIIKKYRKYNKPVHVPSCLFQDPYLENSLKKKQEGIISEGLRCAASRQAAICEGEKSVGKNVYLETIAWLLNMPMYLITFSRQMSPSSIYGEKTTDNRAGEALASFDSNVLVEADKVDEKRRFLMNICARKGMKAEDASKYIETSLTDYEKQILNEAARFKMLSAQSSSVNIVIDASELYDWLTDGGLLVFNEMNMAEANFFASFTNQLLDGTGFLFIPGRGEVAIHKDCVLFGTQNSDYQGVEQQNEATMSRFGCIVFPQPESIKKQLVAATSSSLKKGDFPEAVLEEKYYDECQQFYKQCSDSVKKSLVTNACLNIRGFVRALTTVAESNGFAKLKRQLEIHVLNTCPVDDRMALYSILEQIVTL